MKAKIFVQVVLAQLFLFLIFGLSASAVEYGGIGGRPAYPDPANPRTDSIFVHTVNPGEVIGEGVNVINNTAETKTLLVYAVDSVVSTDGAFACAQAADEKKDVGSWITLEKNEVTLESLTNEVVPFTITVPDSPSVGEHNGCVIVQEKKVVNPDEPKQGGIQLSFRTGLRVALLVPGEIERHLEISDFSVSHKEDGRVLLRPAVTNSGNVSIDAQVSVKTSYFFGASLQNFGGQYPILRGETSVWNYDMDRPFWGGWYKASLTVEYDPNAEAGVGTASGKGTEVLHGATVWFFSMPTTAGLAVELLILFVVIVALFFWYIAAKRKRWIKSSWTTYTVIAGDDVKSLADKFNVSWKVFVKANNLHAPYTLTPGQTLKVPPREQ